MICLKNCRETGNNMTFHDKYFNFVAETDKGNGCKSRAVPLL